MNSAERTLKVAERAATTIFVTMGVALLSSFLTSEGLSAIVWPILGALILGVGLSGLSRRLIGLPAQRMGPGLVAALSLASSVGAAIFLGLVPLALGLGSGAGMSIPAPFILVGVITALASLANVVVLILNIAFLARRQPAP
jgi:hypothetical protein